MRPLMTFFIVLSMIAIVLIQCFSGITTAPIERWDEQTNIDVVKHSSMLGTFPFLMLDGHPFFEKPPLWYYTATLASGIHGVSANTLRFVSAVFGMLFLLLVISTAWKWWGKTAGIISFVLLVTTNHLFVNNPVGIFSTHTLKSADVDSMFLFFLFLSFVFARHVYTSRRFAILTGIISGFAVLTKGPLGIVPFFVASILFYRTSYKKYRTNLLYLIVTFLATVIPWYLCMIYRYGWQFISNNVGYHIFERVVIPLEGHGNSPWFYFSLLANISIFPYGIPFLISGIWIFASGIYRKDMRIAYSFIMALICLATPTLMQTKLAWYILPFYPFAVLTTVGTVSTIGKTGWRK
jgi:4-amino-4-deoxy-L-arabinose transferase-like glycosyltransferase